MSATMSLPAAAEANTNKRTKPKHWQRDRCKLWFYPYCLALAAVLSNWPKSNTASIKLRETCMDFQLGRSVARFWEFLISTTKFNEKRGNSSLWKRVEWRVKSWLIWCWTQRLLFGYQPVLKCDFLNRIVGEPLEN